MYKTLLQQLVLLSLLSFTASGFAASIETTRSNQGLKIAPVALKIANKKLKAIVGTGSYIVNAQAACADCHSCPQFTTGHNPFNGETEQVNATNYLAGGRFLPPATANNLTPDGKGLPGGLTLDAFIKVMKSGKGSNGRVLQWHPGPIYNKMLDQDLVAVYEYLKAIPSAQPDNTLTDTFNCQ